MSGVGSQIACVRHAVDVGGNVEAEQFEQRRHQVDAAEQFVVDLGLDAVSRGGRTIIAIPVPASYSVDLARGSAGPWSVMNTTQVDSVESGVFQRVE